MPEVLLDGHGGFCVDSQDSVRFADHLLALLLDEQLSEEMGEKGFKRYQALFTAKRMAKEYAFLIRN